MGVPGIGKSRLVYELSRVVDAEPELVRWRQGRCLPYGEGITYWALGGMVKAQAGILESDSPEDAAAKLAAAVGGATREESERDWLAANDDWGKPLRVEIAGGNSYRIASAGSARPSDIAAAKLHFYYYSYLLFVIFLSISSISSISNILQNDYKVSNFNTISYF